jgi:hypothetical protein
MRIITPDDAAFDPSGGSPDNPIDVSSIITGVATADVVVPAFEIGPLTQTGPYLLVVYTESSNATASAGTLTATLTYGGGATLITAANLAADGSTQANVIAAVFTSLSVTLDYAITGFGVGSSDFKIIAGVIRLFR